MSKEQVKTLNDINADIVPADQLVGPNLPANVNEWSANGWGSSGVHTDIDEPTFQAILEDIQSR